MRRRREVAVGSRRSCHLARAGHGGRHAILVYSPTGVVRNKTDRMQHDPAPHPHRNTTPAQTY
eukprot:scaffold21095_cov129-Isochrysis_galbana.AAC.2